MILSVRIKNFYSIADEAVVDFTVTKNNPKGFLYKDTGNSHYDKRASLINVMIGPNASGKTNIIKAMCVLRHLIVESQADPEKIGIYYYTPYAMRWDKPTELGIKFSVESRIFEYNFTFSQRRILKEELKEFSKDVERFTEKRVFCRTWNEEKEKYEADFAHGDKIKLLDKDLRDNASVVSVAKQLPRYEFAQMIADYWRDNVVSNMVLEDRFFKKYKNNISYVDELIENDKLHEQVNALLQKLDVGYGDVRRQELELNGEKFYNYFVSHIYGKEKFETIWQNESKGTRRLVQILVQIMGVMPKKDGVVLLDDLDMGMHPDLVEAVVGLFQDEDFNKNGIQLIFNTHDHRVLATLDKQQIFLTEKNENGSTDVWRLDEMEGVRADDNYYTKYMAGAYAAKPRIL